MDENKNTNPETSAEPKAPEAAPSEAQAAPQPELSELDKVRAERDEYLAGWQRAKADFANAKKRMEESAAEYRKYATEGLIEELLPVLTSFEMAFANKEAWEKADKGWRTGVEYIYGQIKGVLTQNGLEEIDPTGQAFDHSKHEAVSYEKAQGAAPDSVIKVIEKGYALNGKLIRPAKVVVAEVSANGAVAEQK